jgi:hypothetical protein
MDVMSGYYKGVSLYHETIIKCDELNAWSSEKIYILYY